MFRHPLTGERFLRVVGRRRELPPGEMPPRATRDALGRMAQHLTRAPKGVFVYPSHDAANVDRERWTVEAIVAAQR